MKTEKEFLKHSGKFTKLWLAKFFSDILKTGNVPYQLKKAKIVSILKPGKANDTPKNYRPIALLSIAYKLFERLLYNRMLTRCGDSNMYNTRIFRNLYIPIPRLRETQEGPGMVSMKIVNHLPPDIKNINSHKIFEKRLKDKLLINPFKLFYGDIR